MNVARDEGGGGERSRCIGMNCKAFKIIALPENGHVHLGREEKIGL